MTLTLKHSFSVHPSVIKSIILEQAGDPCKAIAELVMNSVDAKASYVDITLNAKTFSVNDDGIGFKTKQEILDYFGTFGTPHKDGDATYGTFRIGRGQLFGLASSVWRSGEFELEVNLDGLQDRSDVGFSLKDGLINRLGCRISGNFFTPLHKDGMFLNADHFNENLQESLENFSQIAHKNNEELTGLLGGKTLKGVNNRVFIRLFELLLLVPIPVCLNGVQISNIVTLKKQYSDDLADYYIFDKEKSAGMVFLNRGVHVNTNRAYPVSCVVDFKVAPSLNLARNSLNKNCLVVRGAIIQQNSLSLAGLLKGNAYYHGLKRNCIQALARSGQGLTGVYHAYSFFPRNCTKEELDNLFKIMPLNIVSVKNEKITLYDLMADLRGDPGALKNKYKIISSSGLKSHGGVLALKKSLQMQGAAYTVIYGVGGEAEISVKMITNVEELYARAGLQVNIKEAYLGLECISGTGGDKAIEFVYEGGALSCGDYKEVAKAVRERHAYLHAILREAVISLRAFLKLHLGVLNISEPHLLNDDLPFEVRFMTVGGSAAAASMDLEFRTKSNVHFDDTHFLVFDLKNLQLLLKNLAIDPGNLRFSLACELYALILNAHHCPEKPLNILHDLRVKNEEFLFKDSGFRDEISRWDSIFATYGRNVILNRNNPKKNLLTSGMMQNVQKKYGFYKNFFDSQYSGLSPEIENWISEILNVETE